MSDFVTKIKCDRFTLNFQEFLESLKTPEITLPERSKPVRDSTRQQTVTRDQHEAEKQAEIKWGSIKSYTIQLAIDSEWTEKHFSLNKQELRKFYDIKRREPPARIARLNNEDLLSFLKENSTYRFYINKKARKKRKDRRS